MVTRLLRDVGVHATDPTTITAAPDEAGYRARVLLRAHVIGGTLRVGLFGRGGHELVALERCDVLTESLDRALNALPRLDWSGLPDHRFRLSLSVDTEQGVHAWMIPATLPHAPALASAERLERSGLFAQLAVAGRDAPAETGLYLRDRHDDVHFYSRPGVFEQAHPGVARALREEIRRRVTALAPRTVVDLHCGSGNLSLLLQFALPRCQVTGVDTNAPAVAAAEHSLQRSITTTRIRPAGITITNRGVQGVPKYRARADVDELEVWRSRGERPDVVIVDPPRAGLGRALDPLLALAPAHILVVSCNPERLAAELARACGPGGYGLADLVLFDMFPHTPHVEALAHLRRRAGEQE